MDVPAPGSASCCATHATTGAATATVAEIAKTKDDHRPRRGVRHHPDSVLVRMVRVQYVLHGLLLGEVEVQASSVRHVRSMCTQPVRRVARLSIGWRHVGRRTHTVGRRRHPD